MLTFSGKQKSQFTKNSEQLFIFHISSLAVCPLYSGTERLLAAEATTFPQEAPTAVGGPAAATGQGEETQGVEGAPVEKRSSTQRTLRHLP